MQSTTLRARLTVVDSTIARMPSSSRWAFLGKAPFTRATRWPHDSRHRSRTRQVRQGPRVCTRRDPNRRRPTNPLQRPPKARTELQLPWASLGILSASECQPRPFYAKFRPWSEWRQDGFRERRTWRHARAKAGRLARVITAQWRPQSADEQNRTVECFFDRRETSIAKDLLDRETIRRTTRRRSDKPVTSSRLRAGAALLDCHDLSLAGVRCTAWRGRGSRG